MTKRLVDIDDDLLETARRILGTATKRDTVNGALRELVRRDAAAEFERLGRTGTLGRPRTGTS